MTTILEDLAELCLSSNRKLIKDDNDLLVTVNKLEVEDDEKNTWAHNVVRQLTKAFNDGDLHEPLLKQGKLHKFQV